MAQAGSNKKKTEGIKSRWTVPLKNAITIIVEANFAPILDGLLQLQQQFTVQMKCSTTAVEVSRVRIQISTILQDIKQDSKNILLQDFSSEKGR